MKLSRTPHSRAFRKRPRSIVRSHTKVTNASVGIAPIGSYHQPPQSILSMYRVHDSNKAEKAVCHTQTLQKCYGYLRASALSCAVYAKVTFPFVVYCMQEETILDDAQNARPNAFDQTTLLKFKSQSYTHALSICRINGRPRWG